MDWISQWIIQYGYGALFLLLLLGIVGLPLPDEILMLFSGYLVSVGKFNLSITLIVAFCGAICGISLSYIFGRTLGWFLTRRYGYLVHITSERLDHAHRWFERFGPCALLIGYFIPGFRHLMAYFAGATRLKFWKFACFAYGGGLIWTMTFIITGFYLGERGSLISGIIHRYLWMASGTIFLIIVIYLLSRKLFRYDYSDGIR
jgi:membrane protein DedA with SNARE-associated domain